MYDHTLHYRRKKNCCCCLQTFSTPELLKDHDNNCFKVYAKQMITIARKGEHDTFKNYERKIKSLF